MADFEKVYSVNYDVSKALESLRKLEKVLVRVDTRSRELFQQAAAGDAFDKMAKSAAKAEKATARVGKTAKKSVDSTASAVTTGMTPAMIAFQKKRDAMMAGMGQTARQTKKSVDSVTDSTKRSSKETSAFHKSLDKFAKKVDRINKKASADAQKQTKRRAKNLASDITKQSRGMERLLSQSKRRSVKDWRDIEKAADRTRKAFEATDRANAKAMRPKGERRKARDLMAIGKAGSFASQSIGGLVARMTALLSAAAGIRNVVDGYKDFDQAATSAAAKFSRVEPELRPGTEGFKEFSKEIRAAGIGTEHSAEAVARAVDFWAKAGKTSEQAKAVLATTLNFASANQDASGAMLDVARAGDILSDALGQFNLNVDDSSQLMANTARISDVMSAAANRANVSSEELFEAFVKGGPAMTAVGRDIEETSALMATLANAGIKGSIAGRQLNIAISALTAGGKPQQKLLEKLGVTVNDAEGNFRGLTAIIGDLSKATEDMGTGERFETISRLLGRQGSTAFINFLTTGQAELDNFTESLRGTSGETERLAELMRTSTGAQITKFKNRILELGFTVLDQTDLFGKMTRAIDEIDWDNVSKILTTKVFPALEKVGNFLTKVLYPAVKQAAAQLESIFAPALWILEKAFNAGGEAGEGLAKTLSLLITAWVTYKAATAAAVAIDVVKYFAQLVSGAMAATTAQGRLTTATTATNTALSTSIKQAGKLNAAFGLLQAAAVGWTIGTIIHDQIIEPMMKARHEAKKLRAEFEESKAKEEDVTRESVGVLTSDIEIARKQLATEKKEWEEIRIEQRAIGEDLPEKSERVKEIEEYIGRLQSKLETQQVLAHTEANVRKYESETPAMTRTEDTPSITAPLEPWELPTLPPAEVSETTTMVSAPEIPETPAPRVSVSQPTPEIPETTTMVSAPEIPEMTTMVSAPEIPEMTTMVSAPEIPETPAPRVSVSQPTPEIPETTTMVSAPEIPEIPTPKISVPGTPEIPTPKISVPEIPEIPTPKISVPEIPEMPLPFNVSGLQASVDASAAQETQSAESLNKVVDLLTDDLKRQEARTAETRIFEQQLVKQTAGNQSVVNNVNIGPTNMKVEAHGASTQDVERAARRVLSDAGREIKRGVMDGIRSEGPGEI